MPTTAPRSPLTGKVVNLSPSAIGTYTDCPRAWWYSKVAGKRPPPSTAMMLGTAVHSRVEHYVQHGCWPPRPMSPGRLFEPSLQVARAGESLIAPLALLAHGLETAIKRPPGTLGPLQFFGRVDFHTVDPEAPRVVDYKTTGNMRAKYHLDAASMALDMQLSLYAGLLYPDAEQVRVGHIYLQTTSGPGARELHVDVSRQQLDNALGRAAKAAHEMHELLTVPSPTDVPFKRSACTKYGGCEHAPYCPAVRRPPPVLWAPTTPGPQAPPGANMSLVDSLFGTSTPEPKPTSNPAVVAPASQGAINPTDAPPTSTPTAAQDADAAKALATAVDTMGSYPGDTYALALVQSFGLPVEHLGNVKILAGVTEGQPDHRKELIEAQGQATRAAVAMSAAVPKMAGILGPAARPASPAWLAGDTLHRDAIRAKHPVAVQRDYRAWTEEGLAPQGVMAIEDAKAHLKNTLGLGRMGNKRLLAALALGAELGDLDYSATEVTFFGPEPTADEVVDAPGTFGDDPADFDLVVDAPGTDLDARPDLVDPAPRATSTTDPRKDPFGGLHQHLVLVGCLPTTPTITTDLAIWAADAIAAVEAREGVPHYQLVDYNKGPAMVASLLRIALTQGHVTIPLVLVCPPYHPLTDHVVELLSGHATIIRGVR